MKRNVGSVAARSTATLVCALALALPREAPARGFRPPAVLLQLEANTQGPLWPPGEMSDSNGDFIVVGTLLVEQSGQVVAKEGAAIVSKNTTPPLDAAGREDFSNQLGAPYDIVRYLNLSKGSNDLDMVLYTNSFGPPQGDFGGGSRIPMEGESKYNLSSIWPCPDLFPSESQRFTYKRPSMPMHEYPIYGFEGDDYVYDPDTGEAIPKAERPVDTRRKEPFILGEWLKAKGRVLIRLSRYDKQQGAYTHARFTFWFRDLAQKQVYSIWGVRPSGDRVDPLPDPNVFVTDRRGNANLSFEIPNPFPDPGAPDGNLRLNGIAVGMHPDQQNWGACAERLGPGVDFHAVLNPANFVEATEDFVTVAPAP